MFRALIISVLILVAPRALHIRDEGRYGGSPLKSWFDHLSSQKGLCCSVADGVFVEDPDWMPVFESAKPGVHYRVRINGPWVDVPDEALIAAPNPIGRAMVWVVIADYGMTIQCFMPGNMS